jgi:hypothetical protein
MSMSCLREAASAPDEDDVGGPGSSQNSGRRVADPSAPSPHNPPDPHAPSDTTGAELESPPVGDSAGVAASPPACSAPLSPPAHESPAPRPSLQGGNSATPAVFKADHATPLLAAANTDYSGESPARSVSVDDEWDTSSLLGPFATRRPARELGVDSAGAAGTETKGWVLGSAERSVDDALLSPTQLLTTLGGAFSRALGELNGNGGEGAEKKLDETGYGGVDSRGDFSISQWPTEGTKPNWQTRPTAPL